MNQEEILAEIIAKKKEDMEKECPVCKKHKDIEVCALCSNCHPMKHKAIHGERWTRWFNGEPDE